MYEIYEVKRHSNECHPLFYFISFTTMCSPLTDIVFVHIVYIHKTNQLGPPMLPVKVQIGGGM